MQGIFEPDCPTFGELLVLDGDPAGSLQGPAKEGLMTYCTHDALGKY
jgi:hypothetical protein